MSVHREWLAVGDAHVAPAVPARGSRAGVLEVECAGDDVVVLIGTREQIVAFADRVRAAVLRQCESGCGCRYGTEDPDARDCACDGPCAMADPAEWGCAGLIGASCGGDCPSCPSVAS